MARFLDTTPAFDSFAKKGALESPVLRRELWRELYEGAHPDVFESFYAREASRDGLKVLLTDLSGLRGRVAAAAPQVVAVAEEVEPLVQVALGQAGSPSPLHVLMVGPLSTNGLVGRLGDDVAMFHCLEWFQGPDSWKVLVAHEDTHAWHELALGQRPAEDLAWTAFAEGLAVQVSRQVVPGRAEEDYFWYGFPGFTEWVDWCREHRGDLLERFRSSLDDPTAFERFFGGGMVESHLRVGYFLADAIVAGLERPLPELVAMTPDQARDAVRGSVAAGPGDS